MSSFIRVTCMKVSPVLLFMLFFQVGFGQYNFSKLDALLQQNQKQLGNNIVAMIYRDDTIIYQKELGDFKATTQAPIASCSKWLTAALVMTFVDEGKISLDDKVSTYLPIFKTYGKGYITIRNCLSHLTGIESKGLIREIVQQSRYQTLGDEVNDFASKREIESNPGTAFHYSTVGLNIAARVVEIVGKRSFEQLMTQRILRPMDMKNTTFFSEKAVNPSGGAKSTASDYMNFLVMLLNKGVYNGKRIVSEASVDAMQTSQTHGVKVDYAPAAGAGFEYGLGAWILDKDANGKATVVASPGLFGTWPLVDYEHHYACIFFTKTLLAGEQKKDIYVLLKQAINEQFQ